MLDQLAEGIESIRLPCSWILLFGGAALSVYARRRTPIVLGAFAATAIVLAWVRFSGWWFAAPSGAVQVAVGVALIAATVAAWKLDTAAADGVLGATVGLVTVWSWLPCVGPELGEILNSAPSEPWRHLGGTIAFVAGLLLPFVLLTAAQVASPRLAEQLDRNWLAGAGALMLLALGVLYAGAWSDDLTSELFRASSF